MLSRVAVYRLGDQQPSLYASTQQALAKCVIRRAGSFFEHAAVALLWIIVAHASLECSTVSGPSRCARSRSRLFVWLLKDAFYSFQRVCCLRSLGVQARAICSARLLAALHQARTAFDGLTRPYKSLLPVCIPLRTHMTIIHSPLDRPTHLEGCWSSKLRRIFFM